MRFVFFSAAIAVASAGFATASAAESGVTQPQMVNQTVSTQGMAPVIRDTRRLQRATPETVPSNVRISKRRVVESQLAAQDGVFVPHGYEPVWEDDRLSLTRAHQTYAGQAQSAQIWSDWPARRQIPGQETQAGVFVPGGFEPYWDDDRLSLTRAQQTEAGREQMGQFWSNETPRRLVPRREAGTR